MMNTNSSSLKPISNTDYTCSLSWRFASSVLACFLIRIRLLIGDSFRSKIQHPDWFYPALVHHRSLLFKAFDRRTKIGTDGAELFGAKNGTTMTAIINNCQIPIPPIHVPLW